MFFVCFFSQFVLGQLRMLHKIKSGLQLLEILRTIVTLCLYPPRIWGRREEIWEMSLVSSNFEELSNPSGSHMSHSVKSWSYQYSTRSLADATPPSMQRLGTHKLASLSLVQKISIGCAYSKSGMFVSLGEHNAYHSPYPQPKDKSSNE